MRRIAGLILVVSSLISIAAPAQASSGIVIGLWPQNYNSQGSNASKSFTSIQLNSGITIPYYRSRMLMGQYGNDANGQPVKLVTSDGAAAAADGHSLGLNIQPKFGSGMNRTPIRYVDITSQIESQSGPYYDWLMGFIDQVKALPTYGASPNYIQFHSEANVQNRSPSTQPWMGSVPWTSGNTPPMSYPALAAEYVACYTAIHNLFQQQGATNKIYWQIVLTQSAYAGNQGGAAIWYPSDPSLYDYVGIDAYYKPASQAPFDWMDPATAFGNALSFARARGKQLWIDETGADEGGPAHSMSAKADWFGQLDTYLQNNLNDIAGVVFSNATDGGDWYLDSIYNANDATARHNPVFQGTTWNAWKAAVTDLSAARYTSSLSVSTTGGGRGTVTSSSAGIACPLDCSELVHVGDVVHLTAAADAGSVFAGWGGDCSGSSSTCDVNIDHATAVTAAFDVGLHDLAVTTGGSGGGTVSSDVGGIDCPPTCEADGLQAGSQVQLTAVPDAGSILAGWSGGGCSGTSLTCIVTLSADATVSATFEVRRDLAVTTVGSGGGQVTSTPVGIDCPGTCAGAFADGGSVALHAQADTSSLFTGWSSEDPGFDCPGSGDCTVTMDQARAVAATFTTAWALHVERTGNQPGTVTSDEGSIACGTTCDAMVPDGIVVTLHAADGAHASFDGWSGDCSGFGDCVLTMDRARSLEASYDPFQQSLTVVPTGSGTGTVTSDVPGINCPSTCVHDFDEGTPVTLHASPDGVTSLFGGWSGGGCSGTDDCTITMDTAASVTATFVLVSRLLTAATAGTGVGSVTSDVGGIDCPAACGQTYTHGTSVQLTADPGAGSTFTGWSGDCSGTSLTCGVTMNAARSVTATFVPNVALTVGTTGSSTGSVSSDTGGITCPGTCSATYVQGTIVQLTATPGINSSFGGWSGGGCSGTGVCQITMDAAKDVTATFAPTPRQLTVSLAGTGTGSVASNPSGITCPSTCSGAYAHGTVVQLSAAAGSGSTFGGWSGGGCSGTGACQVTMNAATSVTATFALVPHTLTVVKAGAGTGQITSNPAGLNCPGVCAASYDHGAVVTLAAAPTGGSTFAGWSGGGCTGLGGCQVTMSAAASVTATFNPPPAPTAIKDNDAAVTYNGWTGVSDAQAADGFVRDSAVKNDTAVWKSPPTTSIRWLTRTGPSQGKALVTIDGKSKGTIDLYSAAPAISTKTFSGLTNKAHTIVVKVLHTKSTASSGFNVRLDSFMAGTTTRRSSDPAIAYNAWKSTSQALATDGTFRSSAAAASSVRVTFTGTSIDWKTARGKAYGKASVMIDGVSRGTINLYQVATAWQSVVSFPGLLPGTHTLLIQVLGQKDANATGKTVVVDGFVVHP